MQNRDLSYTTTGTFICCVGVKLCNSHEGKNTLRVFGDRVLRQIFGHKRDEVTEDGENCKE